MRKNAWAVGIHVILIGIGAWLAHNQQTQLAMVQAAARPLPVTVVTAPARRQALITEREYIGTSTFWREVPMTATTQGIVRTLNFRLNGEVRAGQALLPKRLAAAILEQGLWYFLWTVPFFLIFWVFGRAYFANRRIQPVQQAKMHRTIHRPLLYRHVHRVHHESVDTTPFTAYRFHPVEGLLEMGSAVLVIGYVALVPVHIGAIVAWQVGAIAFNVIGHMGYEIYPAWWNNNGLLKWKTTSTHHNMHHERFEGNYGLYFRWWDRLMKTEVADYETTYRALFTRNQHQAEHPVSHQTATVPAGTQARLTVDGLVQHVTVQPAETILDAALRQGVTVPFSRRRGRCGSCLLPAQTARLP